jgi:hypothetical protein
VAFDDVTDPDDNALTTITFNHADEKAKITNSAALASGTFFLVEGTNATATGGTILEAKSGDSDVDAFHAGDGTNYTQISQVGAVTFVGTGSGITPVPPSADGATIGTAALEFSDLFLADGGLIQLGNDQDVLITHVADTGVNITTTAATSGTINLGNDDDVNDDSIDLLIHDGGIITLYDADDDTSASLSVADGATVLTLSGGLTTGGVLDLASNGITNVGNIADDASYTIIGTGDGVTVTVEAVAFDNDSAYGGTNVVNMVLLTDTIPIPDANDIYRGFYANLTAPASATAGNAIYGYVAELNADTAGKRDIRGIRGAGRRVLGL